MRNQRGRLITIVGGAVVVSVVVVLALLVWPHRRLVYITLFYEPFPKFVEVTPSRHGEVTQKDRIVRLDYRRKRFDWIPGPEEAIEEYLCSACLVDNHRECRRRFVMMVRDDPSNRTQHFFHCLCQNPADRPE